MIVVLEEFQDLQCETGMELGTDQFMLDDLLFVDIDPGFLIHGYLATLLDRCTIDGHPRIGQGHLDAHTTEHPRYTLRELLPKIKE